MFRLPYTVKAKAESLPESTWDGFKLMICGEGSIESFPNRIAEGVAKDGWYVDEA